MQFNHKPHSLGELQRKDKTRRMQKKLDLIKSVPMKGTRVERARVIQLVEQYINHEHKQFAHIEATSEILNESYRHIYAYKILNELLVALKYERGIK